MRPPSGFGFLFAAFLFAALPVKAGQGVVALAGEAAAAQSETVEPAQPAPKASPPDGSGAPNASAPSEGAVVPVNICQALGIAAKANDLPGEFFIRLIWQESRFKPETVSRAGAQGVAQFMPGTARMRGLADPFDPFEAIAKSAELLRDLNREFGNLGLAAAAYNAGPGRVRDFLGGRRPLPGETRAYVRIVTGRSAEEWAAGKSDPVEMPAAEGMPCGDGGVALLIRPPTRPLPPRQPVKPWGVELVGGPTVPKALAAYQKLQQKYAAILGSYEPHVVIRGVIGDMGAARVRIGADTRADANKLCADLRSAGSYCDVLRN